MCKCLKQQMHQQRRHSTSSRTLTSFQNVHSIFLQTLFSKMSLMILISKLYSCDFSTESPFAFFFFFFSFSFQSCYHLFSRHFRLPCNWTRKLYVLSLFMLVYNYLRFRTQKVMKTTPDFQKQNKVIERNGIIERLKLEGALKSIQFQPLPRAGLPPVRSGCPGPQIVWPWMPPGTGHPQNACPSFNPDHMFFDETIILSRLHVLWWNYYSVKCQACWQDL